MSVVVSDTSPLQYLFQCRAIDVLPTVFGEVLIPPKVRAELQHPNCPVAEWLRTAPLWLRVQAPSAVDLSLRLDEGEREAISLAREINAIAILIDDRRGRLAATRCGLRVMGTVGFLEEATTRGLLDFRKAVEELKRTNARLDWGLVDAALRRLNLE